MALWRMREFAARLAEWDEFRASPPSARELQRLALTLGLAEQRGGAIVAPLAALPVLAQELRSRRLAATSGRLPVSRATLRRVSIPPAPH